MITKEFYMMVTECRHNYADYGLDYCKERLSKLAGEAFSGYECALLEIERKLQEGKEVAR